LNHNVNRIKDDANMSYEIIDRRKESRYKVKDGIFTVPTPRIQSSRLGNIIDISMGGLAFQNFLVRNMSFNNFMELDIYISGDGMFLDNLPINIISNIELQGSRKQYMTISKRFGVQFREFDQVKNTKLHHFIEHYTIYKV